MKNIYTIGIPATLNLALPSIQVSALNAILAPFPGSYILVLGVYYKLQTFIYLTANGIVQESGRSLDIIMERENMTG